MAHNFLGLLMSFSIRIVTYLTRVWFRIYTSIFKLHLYKKKWNPDPTLIVRIFLFQHAHIQYWDLFIFKHFAFTSKMSKNVLRFLWHGAYHVVVRGGSHFCQSPKSGGVRSFLIKTWGRANTFFWKKYQNSPALPPPPRKNVPSLMSCLFGRFIAIKILWHWSSP